MLISRKKQSKDGLYLSLYLILGLMKTGRIYQYYDAIGLAQLLQLESYHHQNWELHKNVGRGSWRNKFMDYDTIILANG